MTILLYAQPYDISAEGFYFRSADDYRDKAAKARSSFGQIVEEFEIQFIDGHALDCDLARAIGLSQANLAQFLECADAWDEHDKITVILAVGECGYAFERDSDPDDFDVDIYRVDSIRDLAIEFVNEGLFGDIPNHLQNYIDYDAIARDLAMDYSEGIIGGERLFYRCG